MDSAVDFTRVQKDELDEIRRSRAARGCGEKDPADDLLGIAFSGGGIRSATFNLGVLQALAKRRLLTRADYLSTVSGGGYIGSWLQAWIKRSPRGVNDVEDALRGREPAEVGWLRRFSNYLTPRRGLFGADTWTVIAIYLRNLLLTQTVLVSGIVLLLTVAWALFGLFGHMSASTAAGIISLVLMTCLTLTAFWQLGGWKAKHGRNGAHAAIQLRVVAPLIGAAVCASAAVVAFESMGPFFLGATFAGLFVVCWALAAGIAHDAGGTGPTLDSRTILQTRPLMGAFFGGAVAGALLGWLAPCAAAWRPETAAVSLPPIVILLFGLASTIQIGMSGRAFSDPSFEWWGRLGGWLFIYAGGWLVIMGLALFGSELFDWLRGLPASLPVWIATWGGGLGVAISGKDRPSGERSTWRAVLATIAPYGFVIGLLILIAAGYDRVATADSLFARVLVIGIALGIVLRFGQINRLSMHGLYRNRLIRCYLGASNRERVADSFTGFSPDDDMKLSELPTRAGPFGILNTAVNLASTSNLAWQERKAASFPFTPQRCGFDGVYRPTDKYGGGYTLGAAMAISGAAASPNMGFRTSAPFAFLMSMFNIRLGWWSGNPRDDSTWRHQAPRFGAFGYLLRELLGMASADCPHVYLSDGGHFENLGVYELVRRRCRHIIVCDAGADGSFRFEDLGNAVRKCRTDFGADIDLDVRDLVPGDGGRIARHCAVGSITYADGTRGTIVYLKPTLTGDEPPDVRNYAAEHATFPHETTGDQWFAESQFESYRQLGEHIADAALERVGAVGPSLSEYFTRLRYAWFAPARAPAAAVARNAATLDSLVTELRREPELAYLDASFWPEWEEVAGSLVRVPQRKGPAAKRSGAKLTAAQFRAGFYFCRSLLRWMENVFLDLHLDDPRQREHPDNRGWINLFRHFSWAGMLRLTWSISAGTYGVRFQNFCSASLALDVGDEFRLVEHPMNKGQASTAKRRWNALLKRTGELNFHERELLGDLIEMPGFDLQAGAVTLVTFHLDVVDRSGRLPETGFPCGFAVLQKMPKTPLPHLRALRIPDHLRKMGLARRALHALCKLVGGKPLVEPLHAPEKVAGFAGAEQTGKHLKLAAELRHGRAALRGILDSIDA